MGVRFALLGIVISVAVMMVSVCVVMGFKQTITDRVADYTAHIRVVSFDSNNTYEMEPILAPDSLLEILRAIPNVRRVEPFVSKPAVLKTDSAVQGVVLMASPADSVVTMSHILASHLHIAAGDRPYAYFVGDEMRVRRLTVAGLYSTGFAEGDKLFVRVPMPMLRQLDGLSDDEASGILIWVEDIDRLHRTADDIYFATANRFDARGVGYYTETCDQISPQIFAWLDLLDMNVVIILILMMLVASFSMISALIILILDRVHTIGVLKAIGADNRLIRRIFLSEGLMLVGRGMVYGNAVGLGLCALQAYTHLLPLDPNTYYVDFAPVAFPVWLLLGVNMAIILISFCVLMIPTLVAAHVRPVEVLRFE